VELFYGRHARRQMREREISTAEVEAVVRTPERVEQGRDAIRKYLGRAGERYLAVVLAHDVEPPFVVTVMIVTGSEAGPQA
jgi:hypothetical protein